MQAVLPKDLVARELYYEKDVYLIASISLFSHHCSTEARPEDQVELSFLRQSLENAMAAELSPYERDILRLRLGLDDGETRTIREVVEISGGKLSLSEVRLAEQRAYKKLRAPHSLAHYQLIAFLDFAEIDQDTLSRLY